MNQNDREVEEVKDINNLSNCCISDGVLNVYKPAGCSSHDVVSIIKKITGKKVGHTGTLDPLAQGVLPILIGKGTLCSKYLIDHDKRYRVTLKLGIRTSTLDEEGEILEEKEVPDGLLDDKNQFKIEKVFKSMVGNMEQIPPIYSAIKVNGKKLYEYARKGQNVEIPVRKVVIYNMNLLEVDNSKKTITFDVECSKGTYMRTLCEDIANALGTIGYMKNLIRMRVGNFMEEDSFKIPTDIDFENNQTDILKQMIPYIVTVEGLFSKYPKVEIEKNRIIHFLNGVKITAKLPDGVYRVYQIDNKNEKTNDVKFIGIGTIKSNLLKRDIIL